MSKKHDDQDVKDLEEMLEDVKSDKDNEEMIEQLQAEIKKLQAQLAEKDSASVCYESWIYASGFIDKNCEETFAICGGFT